MKTEHRKIYESIHGKTEKGYDIHHIDWDHENNDIENLISIPKIIHQLVHKYWGYTSREELEKVLEEYHKIPNRDEHSILALKNKLYHLVNTKKKDVLSVRCRVSMEYDRTNFRQNFNWRDGKGGM